MEGSGVAQCAIGSDGMEPKSLLNDLLVSLAERSRALVRRADPVKVAAAPTAAELTRLGNALVAQQGEALRVSEASSLTLMLESASRAVREEFLCATARSLALDQAAVDRTIEAYRAAPTRSSLAALHYTTEPRSLELLRRINLAPGGTSSLVRLRETLLDMLEGDRFETQREDLASLNKDFLHLFGSWFNRGFLVMRRIDWSTPASILERIIRYEAVHAIRDWRDLRSRIDPHDRRCFAFFHPALVDEPLIFVEVALTSSVPRSISSILDERRPPVEPGASTTAVFYSISNCQRGLTGVSFGDFLIKQVVEDLRKELPGIRTFVTLSPVPGFGAWLEQRSSDPQEVWLPADRKAIEALRLAPAPWDTTLPVLGTDAVSRAAARYLLQERTRSGKPLDPVARFHLGNGATLQNINLFGDVSEKGIKSSLGLMVNYLYDLDKLDANQKAFASGGEFAASDDVRRLLAAAAADKKKNSAAGSATSRTSLARMFA